MTELPSLVHVPGFAVSVSPDCGVPLIDGAAVFCGALVAGGGAAATGPAGALVAIADPPSLLAVTVTVMLLPRSPVESLSVCPVVPSDHW